MKRALTANEVIRQKKKVFAFSGEWREFIDQPERSGVWFIWGNSGNGKSSFVMQLCRELAKFDKVCYNSLEEGTSLTMQRNLLRAGMADLGGRFVVICETMEELKVRLRQRKSPNIIVIDSFQYARMNYREYQELREAFKSKLFIFISHANGRNPAGKVAESVKYDATLKIWVEGHKAFSIGRFIGETGEYTSWVEGARRYWSNKTNDNNNEDND